MKSFRARELSPTIQTDSVDLRMAEAGPMTVSFIRLAAGTDLGPSLVGLADGRCPCPHWGYMLDGALTMRTPDGDRHFSAGDAFYWAPGHVPITTVDCAYVSFSPSAELHDVVAYITVG